MHADLMRPSRLQRGLQVRVPREPFQFTVVRYRALAVAAWPHRHADAVAGMSAYGDVDNTDGPSEPALDDGKVTTGHRPGGELRHQRVVGARCLRHHQASRRPLVS